VQPPLRRRHQCHNARLALPRRRLRVCRLCSGREAVDTVSETVRDKGTERGN
jgi:hypothetical protein